MLSYYKSTNPSCALRGHIPLKLSWLQYHFEHIITYHIIEVPVIYRLKKSQYHMYDQDRYYVFSSLTVLSPHSGQATGRGKCLVALTSAERSFTVGIPDIRCFLRSLMFIFSWALLHTLTDVMGTLQSFLTRTATVPTIWSGDRMSYPVCSTRY